MRLSENQARAITQIAHEFAGVWAQLRVFGSMLNEDARGGDLDILLAGPKLMRLPIHDIAFKEGKVL